MTSAPSWLPVGESQRLQNLYATAFFKKHLSHDSRYDSFLTPAYDTANEPGVHFFRKDQDQ